jgi:ADP-ribosylglycohydrolase
MSSHGWLTSPPSGDINVAMPRTTLYESTRLGYAEDSLAGLSVGDALGEQFFQYGRRYSDLLAGNLPPPVWMWTDDTEMACSVFWMLRTAGEIDQDRLASAFAERCHPDRGYGVGAFTVLRLIREGTPWRLASADAFGGAGSYGNGAAMRAAPLGAYFPDSPERAARQAVAAAEVTHAHPEGVAGAVAVAVAASLAAGARMAGRTPAAGVFLDSVRAWVPRGRVRAALSRARRMLRAAPEEAAGILGNGEHVTAQDTVPYTVWVAARFLADYPAAVRACVQVGGDIDTTSAIVGGIVAAHTGMVGIPADWLTAREPLPSWL